MIGLLVLEWGVKLFGLFFVMIVCHEIGHVGYFWGVLDKHPKIRFVRVGFGLKVLVGEDQDYNGLSERQLSGIYLSGVFAGLVPYFVVGVLTNWNIMFGAMLLPYAWGSMPDIVRAIDMLKKVKVVEDDES